MLLLLSAISCRPSPMAEPDRKGFINIMKHSVDAIALADGAMKFSYVLTRFLPVASERRALKSPTVMVGSSLSPGGSTRFALCILMSDTYTLEIVVTSWRTDSVIIMQCPSLSLIIFLALKSALLKSITAAISFGDC